MQRVPLSAFWVGLLMREKLKDHSLDHDEDSDPASLLRFAWWVFGFSSRRISSQHQGCTTCTTASSFTDLQAKSEHWNGSSDSSGSLNPLSPGNVSYNRWLSLAIDATMSRATYAVHRADVLHQLTT